jgi:hypothetical protein
MYLVEIYLLNKEVEFWSFEVVLVVFHFIPSSSKHIPSLR